LDTDRSTLDVFLDHRSSLIDYVTLIVGSRAQAEEIVQEAYIRHAMPRGAAGATKNGSGGRESAKDRPASPEIESPVAYLYRIVRNLALDSLRRASRRAETGPLDADATPPIASGTPEDIALHRDQLRAVAMALMELPERTRTAFNLYRIERQSLKQVAEHLQVSTPRAHQLVKTALCHVARRLDEMNDPR